MKKFNRFFKRPATITITAVILFTTVVSTSFVSRNFEIAKNLDIFATLFRELTVNYVDDVNPAELIQTGIDEMLYSLDPYTTFIPESDIEDVRFMTTGQYGGIGALIMRRGEYIFVSETYDGFPAEKGGLLPGDKILEIDDQSAKNRTQEEVSTLLKGEPGSEVNLKIERGGHDQPITKTLIREVVKIDNIPYYGMLNNHTGYIKLTAFTQNAGKEVRDAFSSLRDENDLQHIVLDLRGNGGGLLNEAVNITNIFVDKDELIVETRGKLEERNTTHQTRSQVVDKDIPLVVLVDGASASASEIVAGAIQDLDRGVVIGQRTFGKGLVQNIVPLSYNTQLKVTVAKYYIPSGRCIQAIDYAERNEDGSVAAIPDSLMVAFETRNGRTVYDGGGIEPDLQTEPRSLAPISIALLTKFHIFEFANTFYQQNDEIPPADKFEITDEIFDDFVHFLEGKDYSYTTTSEAYINEVKKAAKEEAYYASIQDELELIRNKIDLSKADDLVTHREEIEEILKNEISGRYYKQRGRVIASLKDDPEVLKAIGLLSNLEKYHEILKP